MEKKLELPQSKVRQKKGEVQAAIKGMPLRSADQLYARTIRLVNEPTSMMAAMVLDESKRLRQRLNLLVLLGRLLHLLALGTTIAALILWSYWPFLIAVGSELVWYFVISRRQTMTNIEVGATTEVFCEMMACDPEFRSRVIDTVRRRYGEDVAANFASLFALSGENIWDTKE